METGITAVVIGGGQSECLRVHDEYIPKALVPVAGRPLLEHQLEWLRRAGIDSAVLCLDYRPEQVRARFADGSGQGMRLRYSVADAPRGTAGQVKALGPASLPDDVLVLFGDIFPETDCGRMIRFHRGHQGLATLALHECRPDLQVRRGCAGEPVVLTRLEFDLLAFLVRRPDEVFKREDLLESVWNYPVEVATRTLDKHVETLRRKLADEHEVPAYVIFSDKTLKDMASKVPRTPAEFRPVHGVGEAKLEAYATIFLRAIDDCAGT